MGLLSKFFRKQEEPPFGQVNEVFVMCSRQLKVILCQDASDIYSSQMDIQMARVLAAQVVNFLMAEDIDEIARVSQEPLRSRIMAIFSQVRQRAAEYMQADRQTREIIVATLRMTTFLNFWKYAEAWSQNPEKMRIERLLVEYGSEFPEEITPEKYIQLFAAYRAIKRSA